MSDAIAESRAGGAVSVTATAAVWSCTTGRPERGKSLKHVEVAASAPPTPGPDRRQAHPHQGCDLNMAAPLRGEQHDPV